MSERPAASQAELEGLIERVTYQNPENGYTVARLQPAGGAERVTVVGPLGGLAAGDAVRLWGAWSTHPKHGTQFTVRRSERAADAGLAGLEAYLGSGAIKGVGPAFARKIVAHFGAETAQVLESAPGRLSEVPGLGAQRAERVAEAWRGSRQLREVMGFLSAHELSGAWAQPMCEAYGEQALAIARETPYRLMEDLAGFGFAAAERLAMALGLARSDQGRLRAGLLQALTLAAEQGHTFLPLTELLGRAGELLGVAAEPLAGALDALARDGGLVVEQRAVAAGTAPEPAVYLPVWHAAEAGLAARVRRRLLMGAEEPPALEATLAALEAEGAWALSAEQRAAVLAALRSRLFVLTGGPGTGKTTTVRALVALLKHYDLKLLLASPTGRAARRLSEVTGEPAQTVHRLLEFVPERGDFARDADRPLEADVVLVDEASMLDVALAARLLAALPPLGTLVLVGDAHQLPSVGPGQVLADLLASPRVPRAALSRVFRQAEESAIVANAHRLLRGEEPSLVVPDGATTSDCYFVEAEDPAIALARVAVAVGKSLPKRFGLDPARDIQVLCPMNRGPVGTQALNERLQAVLNAPAPDKPSVELGGRTWRVGDRVIQRRNNYDKQVFNGDMGTLSAIDLSAQTLEVEMLDGPIAYAFSEAHELGLAYAITIHKSQGSEFPVVVVPWLDAHQPMLQRDVLYTALTRAQRLVVFVGTRRAIARAVARHNARARHSRLAERLDAE